MTRQELEELKRAIARRAAAAINSDNRIEFWKVVDEHKRVKAQIAALPAADPAEAQTENGS